MDRRVLRPIGRRLSLLFVGLLLLLGTVCAVAVHQLNAMRTDASRLLEESRELALSNDLDAHFESIGLLLQLDQSTDDSMPFVHDLLAVQIRDVQAILREIDAGPGRGKDPSRIEHQVEELDLTRSLYEDLRALDRHIESSATALAEDTARIAEMRGSGRALEEEAREEAEHAERDLRLRARSATRIMAWTVVLVALGLGATLAIVLLTIVRPLRALKARVDEVGRGHFAHAPGIESQDEIGALARSFEQMATKVAATQEALEHRVAARTRELARAARYADLGVLAAGVAHEINNPLASIASCAEGLQRRLERGTLGRKEEADYFRTIASEAYRARDITQRLLTLARQDATPPVRVVLRDLAHELGRVTKHQLEKRSVRLVLEVPDGLDLLGNPGELLQALVNLVLNARDATPPGGTVRVVASREGDSVLLDVDDQGSGVPADLVERIFEPFFTTKEPGEGTGLGLSLVAAIVESHGGSIVVDRAPGGGARFRLRLPAFVPRLLESRS